MKGTNVNKYFNHIATSTPGMLSSLFIWKDWIGETKEAGTHIDDAINALISLNDLLINIEECEQQSNRMKLNNNSMKGEYNAISKRTY